MANIWDALFGSSWPASQVLASPNGNAGPLSVRALVTADIPSGTVLWNQIGNASGALTLANDGFSTTFNQTNAVNWTWANTTPTVASFVLTQVAVSGGSTTYTGTITGGGANAYVGASIAFAGFTNGGNNVTAVVTASTATTLVVATTSQVNETHAGTAVSSAVSSSPIYNLNGTYTTGAASATDSWSIQNIIGGVAANPTSYLTFTHIGTTGLKGLQVSPVVNGPLYGWDNGGGAKYGIGDDNGPWGPGTVISWLNGTRGAIVFNGISIPAAASFYWANNINVTATRDTNLSRISAGTIGVGTGVSASIAGNLQLNIISNYGGTATVSQGVPSEIVTVDLTAQSAAIVATNLTASAPRSGMYRIAWSATITTAGTTSVLGGTNGFQVTYTSPTDSVVKTTVSGNSVTSAANTTGTAVGDDIVIYAKTGTAIQYKYDYTSTGTAMVYELHIKVEAM